MHWIHRLQGQTKEALICVDWAYSVVNWIYVVLSRVTTRKGLFLMQKLVPEKVQPPKESLLQHEDFLQNKEKEQNMYYPNLIT